MACEYWTASSYPGDVERLGVRESPLLQIQKQLLGVGMGLKHEHN